MHAISSAYISAVNKTGHMIWNNGVNGFSNLGAWCKDLELDFTEYSIQLRINIDTKHSIPLRGNEAYKDVFLYELKD